MGANHKGHNSQQAFVDVQPVTSIDSSVTHKHFHKYLLPITCQDFQRKCLVHLCLQIDIIDHGMRSSNKRETGLADPLTLIHNTKNNNNIKNNNNNNNRGNWWMGTGHRKERQAGALSPLLISFELCRTSLSATALWLYPCMLWIHFFFTNLHLSFVTLYLSLCACTLFYFHFY